MTCFGTTTPHREQNSCSKQKPPYRHDTTLERGGSVMKIIDRWNEIMGPKDERLAAEANRCAAIGYTILIIGSALCLYYGIMLNQVAEDDRPSPAHAVGPIGLPRGYRPAHCDSRLGPHLHLPASAQRRLRHPCAHRPIGSHPLGLRGLGGRFCAASDWASPQQPCAFSRKCRSSASRT